MPLAKDLLHPSLKEERRKCKLKRLVQSPNSYFLQIKCNECYRVTTIFSHAQSAVVCSGCNKVISTPTGGKGKISKGCRTRIIRN
ncbi:hypothetical protein SNEBB_006361 [Seison nebaliae]|nr:hypothetical protein SNEBB_006361 [Seison nebaliae]